MTHHPAGHARLRPLAAALALAVVAPVVAPDPADAQSRRGTRPQGCINSRSDFNEDGYDDLVIASPYDDVAGHKGAGVVHVLYGGPNGPKATGSQVWHQGLLRRADKPSLPIDPPEPGDRFGWSVAVGDFDGDCYSDLAVGVPYEDIGAATNTGAVHVIYGSSSGLKATGSGYYADPGVVTAGAPPQIDHQLGYALAAVDYVDLGQPGNSCGVDRDNRDDLAIGSPGAFDGRGQVVVVAGSLIDPGQSAGVSCSLNPPGPQVGDRAGHALAAGRLFYGGAEDVVVGAPGRDVDGVANAGTVWVYTGDIVRTIAQGRDGIKDAPEAGDRFGQVLAVGDLNKDDREDIVVGVPLEDVGSVKDAGAVHVLMNDGNLNLDLGAQLFLTQNARGVPGSNATNDRFGSALAIGDFGDPGASTAGAVRDVDLAVGIRGKDVAGRDQAGAAVVLYWVNGVRRKSLNILLTQNSPNVLEVAETGDRFGASMTALLGASDIDTLVIGAPWEDRGALANAGVVHVFKGRAAGPSGAADKLWHQDTSGIGEKAQSGDRFGFSLGQTTFR